MTTDSPLFNSAHAALIFAFHYSGQQSPRSPMTQLLGGHGIGSGKGLHGLDGAAQAGLILAEFDRLSEQQRHVLLIRFGDVRHSCPCCGQMAPSEEWMEALDAVSWSMGLEGYPRKIRHGMIEKAVCRRKWDAKQISDEHGISERTLRHQIRDIKTRIAKIESQALNDLYSRFSESGICG